LIYGGYKRNLGVIPTSKSTQGQLIIIGGKEDKEGEQTILKHVVRLLHGDGMLLLLTIASKEPEEQAREYRKVFKELGVENMEWIDLRIREDGLKEENIEKIEQADMLFFTGGDQLRITSQMGDTAVYSTMQERFQNGLHVMGTSAGAAVLPHTMLITGSSDESNQMHNLGMAQGLGLIEGVVVDSHFAQRGRIGRLLGAVAENPANMGLGIDENTAVIIGRDDIARVIGDGAVYFVDGTQLSYSSLSEEVTEGILSIYRVQLHVLAEGKKFNLTEREPIMPEEAVTKAAK
jgi:cyanophycinase